MDHQAGEGNDELVKAPLADRWARRILLGSALLAATAWGICFVLTYHSPYCETDRAIWGQFGDTFGVVTSLFSALAFIGVVYTGILQREQYKLQLRENTLNLNLMSQQLAIAKQQLENDRIAKHYQMYLEASKIFDEFARPRGIILSKQMNHNILNHNDQLVKRSVYKTYQGFNKIAIMALDKMLPLELLYEEWGDIALRCEKASFGVIQSIRSERNNDRLFSKFDLLLVEIKKYYDDKGYPLPQR